MIKVSNATLKHIGEQWVEYFKKNKQKIFKRDIKHLSFDDILNKIEKADSFQITAFAGKVQNEFTHPMRMPDLGDFNILCKIKAIQDLTNTPVQIILDGEYYADIFGEDLKLIRKYENKLKELAELIKLNHGCKQKPFMTIREFLVHSQISPDILKEQIEVFRKSPELAYATTGMLPHHFYNSVTRFLSSKAKEELEATKNYKSYIYRKSSEFIVRKAALASALKLSKIDSNSIRITILKYKNYKYPRLNLEMNMAPWNSCILFKTNYLNINTTINDSYTKLTSDARNYPIVDESGYFWGFSRKDDIFKFLQ